MQERVAAEAAETTTEPTATAAAQGPAVARQVLALQRTAGNAAVNRLIARQELNWDPSLMPPDISSPPMRPIQFVFILGAKDDEALSTAEAYYRSALMTSPFRKVVTLEELPSPTLGGVLDYLSQIDYELAEITLVVHGNDRGELIVPLNREDTDDRTTPDELAKALDDRVLNPLSAGQITEKTRIRLQACLVGNEPRIVNLLDKAFGGGEGIVIAPKVEVAYAKNVWHSEGLSGWIIKSERSLDATELAAKLKETYGHAVGSLDLGNYQHEGGAHPVGTAMKTNDEMWTEMARLCSEETEVENGKTVYVYIPNAYTQGVKVGYEDDPVLYTKSVIYNPKEI